LVGVNLFNINNIFPTSKTKTIKDDFDAYDWTDAEVIYHNCYVYIVVPKECKVLIWNIVSGVEILDILVVDITKDAEQKLKEIMSKEV